MIRQILPIVVAACVAPCFAAEGWITDMDAAKKQAAEQKKDPVSYTHLTLPTT